MDDKYFTYSMVILTICASIFMLAGAYKIISSGYYEEMYNECVIENKWRER